MSDLSESDLESIVTLFAPTDSAFAHIEDAFLSTLSPDELSDILFYHAVDSEILVEDLVCQGTIEMLSGGLSRTMCVTPITNPKYYQKGGGNRKNDLLPKIDFYAGTKACDGVVHVVDEVMLPNYVPDFD